MKPAYYNEIDPFAAAWLRELIAAGEIAPGDVDTRSITDVAPDDLVSYGQCHFFAGIGGWSLALRLAGVPDDVPIWTGSCPCQPFSVAGKGRGTADERHLWPDLFRLIAERRPAVCLGEQVSGRAGLDWLAAVRADLEDLGYAVGAADLCAAGVGAPHIRQRIYWGGVADADSIARYQGCEINGGSDSRGDARARAGFGGGVSVGRVGDADRQRRDGVDALLRAEEAGRIAGGVPQAVGSGEAGGGMGNASGEGLEGHRRSLDLNGEKKRNDPDGHGAPAGFWSDCEWIACADNRARPIEPGVAPLADGLQKRMGPRRRGSVTGWTASQLRRGLLRGYGNAIVPQVGAAYARAFLEAAGVTA